MTRVETAPFLRVLASRVAPEAWIDATTGAPVPTYGIEGWDPSVDLVLERRIAVDPVAARADAGLSETARLACAATWLCPATTVRGAGSRVALDAGSGDVTLELHIPGSELAGRVDVRTTIVLVNAGEGERPLAPHIPGSVLWEDTVQVPVEGGASRFPMEWLNFASAGWLPAGAGWYLEWSPEEPGAPAMARSGSISTRATSRCEPP